MILSCWTNGFQAQFGKKLAEAAGERGKTRWEEFHSRFLSRFFRDLISETFLRHFFLTNVSQSIFCLSDINYTLFLSRLVHEAFQFLTMKRKKKKDIPAKF